MAPALVIAAGSRLAYAAAPVQTAKEQLAEADKAARVKNWQGALAAYRGANATQPSAAAQVGIANANYQLQQIVPAYEAYDELLKTYGTTLNKAQKAEADARMKELSAKVGSLSVRVNEAGASVQIDGKEIGTSPVSLHRLPVGAHTIRVTKEGFAAFDIPKDISAGAPVVVDVVLVREVTKGKLVVREKTGAQVRVILDGIDVGPAPWDGDVDPGKHEVTVRSSTLNAMPQQVDVAKGETLTLELSAAVAGARVEIRTSDGKGMIYIDGKPAAEGAFVGDVSVGQHDVEVRREGFETFRKQVTLKDKESYAEAVTLRSTTMPGEGPTNLMDRPIMGVYGGFGLMGAFGVGGMGTELETHCLALGATNCDTGSPAGGGAFGYVGYAFNPVGFEVMLGGLADLTTQAANFSGVEKAGANPLLASPARKEEFKFLRVGGMAALRVRVMADASIFRFTAAAGLGLAYKQMLMERDAASPDGRRDIFVPSDSVTYFSPAISGELAVQFRISPTIAIAAGGILWAENAGENAKVAPDNKRFIAGPSGVTPIATPEYHLASSTQIFLGPFLGMQFGP